MESAENIEQQITLLSRELELAKVRFGRWLVVCCVFAVAASAIAVGTKSISFFVIAGLGWFFAWNRWKSRAFVSALSSKPVPSERYLKAGSLVLLIALCIARPLSAADPQEQTWFTAENPTVDRPVDLPKNVQASLMK